MKVLLTGDIHGCPAYLSRLKTAIDQEREADSVLLFDSGDPGVFFQPRRIGRWFDAAMYDGSVLGNDVGRDHYAETLLSHHPHSRLCANCGSGLGPRSRTIPIDDLVVGLFGLNPPFPYGRKEAQRRYSFDALLTDPTTAAREIVKELRDSCDFLICVSHLGLRQEVELLETVPEIDLCLGGHSHHRVGTPARVGGGCLVQAGCNGAYLETVEIDAADREVVGGALQPSWAVPVDYEFEAELRQISMTQTFTRGEALSVDESLGELPACLEDPWRENRFANFLTDIVRQAADADIAFLKANSILPAFDGGTFARWDLERCFHGLTMDESMDLDLIHVAEVPGRLVRAAVEHAVSDLPSDAASRLSSADKLPSHNLLQFSGLSVAYALENPVGTRSIEVLVGGHPLQDDDRYTVATDGFLAQGFSGYRFLGDGVEWRAIGPQRPVVEAAFGAARDLPEIEGRLRY